MTSVLRKSGASHARPSILWFTLLCSLLGALWSLNLFPQGPVTFRVQTTVVLNSSRLDVLEQMLASDHPSLHHPDCRVLRKLSAKELASKTSDYPVATRTETELPDLHCITLESEWNRKVDAETIKSWLSTLTEPSTKILSNTQTARDLRWVTYKLDLAQRYQTADAERNTDASERTIAAQTVGFSTEEQADEADAKLAMLQTKSNSVGIDIGALEQKAAALTQQLQSERFDLMGTVSLSSLSKWTPKVSKDPLVAPMIGLLIGAVAGVSLAYVLRRKPTTKTTNYSHYASTLEELQIPLFHVGPKVERSESAQHEQTQRRHLQWWISGCEWSLLFWGLSAAVRFTIDSNWRDLSISQPLIALARLFSSV
jgi:hypothetical protein